MKGKIEIDRELCKGCCLCMAVCPKKLIEVSEGLNKKGYYPAEFKETGGEGTDDLKCTGCALCAVMCPDVAIVVYRAEKDKSKAEKKAES